MRLIVIAQEAIDALGPPDDQSTQLLFACVSETLRHGNKRQQAIVLQKILNKFDGKPPQEIDLGALLRYERWWIIR